MWGREEGGVARGGGFYTVGGKTVRIRGHSGVCVCIAYMRAKEGLGTSREALL